MNNSPTLNVSQWTGIRNKVDARILGLTGFTLADNVRIDSSGNKLFARAGQTELNDTAYRGGFATKDKSRAYAITEAGDLILWPDTVLHAGFAGEPYWAELNDFVLVGNETQTWRITADGLVSDNAIARPNAPALTVVDGSLPAGVYRVVTCAVDREESAPSDESTIEVDGTQAFYVSGSDRIYVCPANGTAFFEWLGYGVYTGRPEFLGPQLKTKDLWPMPNGNCLTFYQNALHAATYMQRQDMSVIWRSKGLWHGLADLKQDVRLIPGRVLTLQGHAQGMFVGTDRELGAITDEGYTKLADYGVAPGRASRVDERGTIWCLTQRGFVSAFPFVEVAKDFAPPECNFVSSAVIREGGDTYLIALASPTGDPDNSN